MYLYAMDAFMLRLRCVFSGQQRDPFIPFAALFQQVNALEAFEYVRFFCRLLQRLKTLCWVMIRCGLALKRE